MDTGLKVLEQYFLDNPYALTRHHLDSFNYFVFTRIPMIVASMNPIAVYKPSKTNPEITRHKIEVWIGGSNGNELFLDKPTLVDAKSGVQRPLLPNEARMYNYSYTSDLYANVLVRYTFTPDPVFGKNEPKKETITEERLERVKIGSIPIMLHSKLCTLYNKPESALKELGECVYDKGGYFIVDGKEKVIIAQERNVTNTLFASKSSDPKYTHEAFIRCTSESNSVFPKTIYFKVFSREFTSGARANAIVVRIPHIDAEIPLFMLFRVLGIETDRLILKYILNVDPLQQHDPEVEKMHNFLHASIVDGNMTYSQQNAVRFLAKKVKFESVENLFHVIDMNLFPNMEGTNLKLKATYLGQLVNTLIKTCLGIVPETDRDNYMYKRIGISGFLLGDIFKDYYNKFRVECRNKIDAEYQYKQWFNFESLSRKIGEHNQRDIFNPIHIASGLVKSLKGSWGLDGKQGIVQDLNRISYQGFISHLRRVNTPMDASIKLRRPHQLNTSHFGVVCPSESPDGGSIGLLKNFAIMCHISFDVPSSVVFKALAPFGVKYHGTYLLEEIQQNTKVYINNNWAGIVDDNAAPKIVRWIKLLRRNGLINIFTSVSWNIQQQRINISTDNGRCLRPLFIVDSNNKSLLIHKKKLADTKWQTLLGGDSLKNNKFNPYFNGYIDPFELFGRNSENSRDINDVMDLLEKNSAVIEFIDVEETNNSLIAMSENDLYKANYTHCELHPSTIFSAYTLSIPFTNHNATTRIVFSGAQGKQAIGLYATNFNNRIDTMSYVLHYPQKPIIKTRFCDYTSANNMPNGENLIVAIATYTGYNQEDSIILNKRSIERGMFNLSYFKCIASEELTDPNSGERIVFANKNTLAAQGIQVQAKYARYDKLDEMGLPIEGSFIQEQDAIIGKFMISKKEIKNTTDEVFDDEDKNMVYTDRTEVADKTVEGIVDKVLVFKNKEGVNQVKIRMRKFRKPELGDKMASRHGQKGVAGMIMPAENMPFTKDGIVPDIIINPHAFPSRLTVGHLLECLVAKACVMQGTDYDAMPFESHNLKYWEDILEKKYKMNKYGDELLTNGFTGEQIPTQIFFGPTYYFRLKHMVADKVNYRTTGRVMGLTKQPTKGRSNEGGLRIGEMETNCIISHGMSGFLKESFIERSDKYQFYVDAESGDISKENSKYTPRLLAPYAFKLLMQEVQTMGIKPTIMFDNDDIDYDDADGVGDIEVDEVFDDYNDEE